MATLAAAGIGAAGSLLGGITGGKGAKKAAKIAAQTADKDRAFAQQINNQNVSLATPFLDRGDAAGSTINALLGIGDGTDYAAYVRSNPDLLAEYQKLAGAGSTQFADMADYGKFHYDTYGAAEGRDLTPYTSSGSEAATNALQGWKDSTAYTTGLNQGLESVNTGYAAKGALDSGAAMKAISKYGSDYADSKLGQYLGLLQGQQGVGVSALGSITGSNNALAGLVTSANDSAGTAAGNAALLGSASTQNALSGVASAIGGYFGQSSYGNALPPLVSGTASNNGPISSTTGYSGNWWTGR